MGKYKYLFYDFDGTISNTYEGVAEVLKATFDHYGLDVDPSMYRKYIGPPISETFASYIMQILLGLSVPELLKLEKSCSPIK